MLDLKKDLLPCDIIDFMPNDPWSWNPATWWASLTGTTVDDLIQQDAKNFFGTDSGTDWQPVHTQLYLGPQNIYRAVPPKLTWDTVDQIIARGDKVRVFRSTQHVYTPAEAQIVIDAFNTRTDYTSCGFPKTEQVIGSDYDTWTDVWLGISSLFDNPVEGFFNMDGGSRLICSAGSFLGLEFLRLALGSKWPRMFSTIQPTLFKNSLWGPEVIKAYASGKMKQVDMVFPADFANTRFYGHELFLVGQNF